MKNLPHLPVLDSLPALLSAFTTHDRVCLMAPPGTGKTTRIPHALHQSNGQGVVLLEPRRLAARTAARYMAAMLDEPVGRTVGYRVRMDSKVSKATRITVVTEGVLTRLLRENPELPGIGWLVFDEFHERHLQGDLGLALALECQETMREADNPLRILVMSATLEPGPLSALLGKNEPSHHTLAPQMTTPCPLIHAEAKSWPVETRHLPPKSQELLEPHALRGIRAALGHPENKGGVLVFLPGEAEIRRTQDLLTRESLPPDVSVHPLYGNLSPDAQDAAIAPPPDGCRKIVLATSIAESSLTIEGVNTVVDCGLARTSRLNPDTGMARLVTGRVSLSAADQRRGRAGRTGPGLCIRLWDQTEEIGFRTTPRPEILDADLADLRLELALWGLDRPDALRWLDVPPQEAWESAEKLLCLLDALTPDANGRLIHTPHATAMAALPVHPRMAHMLSIALDQDRQDAEKTEYKSGSVTTACLLAALLDERDPLRGEAFSVDARLRLEWLARRPEHRAHTMARRLRAGLQNREALPKAGTQDSVNPELAGVLLALAYPDRVAQLRAGTTRGLFRLTNGRGGRLNPDDPLAESPFLALGEVDGNGPDCRIFQAAPLTEEDVRTLFAAHIHNAQAVWWDAREEAVLARFRETCGALILRDAPLTNPDPERMDAARLEGFRTAGLAALPWTPELLQWRSRIQFLHDHGHDPDLLPNMTDAALLESMPHWLLPVAQGINRRNQWRGLDLHAGLMSLFPQDRLHTALRQLEKDAPEHLCVPSGSHIRLAYPESSLSGTAPNAPPVLAVKLQELFGLSRTPTVAGVPVRIHLLSPAGRPLQVTSDLAGFWTSSYAAVRAEMRGRYPRHPWPENPLEATATRKTNPRR